MLDQATLTGRHERLYLLTRDPSLGEPSPSSACYEPVEHEDAVRIVCECLCDCYGNPNWSVLRLLEIAEHPRNFEPRELELLVASLLRNGHAHRFLLYRRREELRQGRRIPPDPNERLQSPAPGAPLDFVGLELVDDDNRPVPAVRLQLELPDGSHRILVTDEQGTFLLDQVAAGTCVLTTPSESLPPSRR